MPLLCDSADSAAKALNSDRAELAAPFVVLVPNIENVCPNEDKKIWISHLAINGIVHEL